MPEAFSDGLRRPRRPFGQARPQLAPGEIQEGERRLQRLQLQRGVDLAAEPREGPLEASERIEVVEGDARLHRNVAGEEPEKVTRRVPRHEEARRQELAPRRAPPAHEKVSEELAREPPVGVRFEGLAHQLRYPRRHPAAVEEDGESVRTGDAKLVEVEDPEFE